MKKKIMTLTAAVAAISLTSCGVYQDPNAPQAHRNAATGAAIGGVLGGIIGKQSDETGAGAVLGAAAGGALGYAHGQQKDRAVNTGY